MNTSEPADSLAVTVESPGRERTGERGIEGKLDWEVGSWRGNTSQAFLTVKRSICGSELNLNFLEGRVSESNFEILLDIWQIVI